MAPVLSATARLVRTHDPDRYLATLFAPARAREALFVLYAFNHEIARAPEVTREPDLAQIRLAWWREVVEGAERHHEVATPLAALIAEGRLEPAMLLALIAARENEIQPAFPTIAAWRAHLFAGAGSLAVAAGRLLGAEAEPALLRFGAAYGAAGILRSIPFHARGGRVLLPQDVLTAHGLSEARVAAAPGVAPLLPVLRILAREAEGWLAEARSLPLPPGALPAALPAVLARSDLHRPGSPPRQRGIAARLAMLRAALSGRI